MSVEFLKSGFCSETERSLHNLKIGVDVDGVIANIDDNIARLIKKRFKFDLRSVTGPVPYDLAEWPQIKKDPHGSDFIKHIFTNSYIYEKAKPVSGSIEVLNKWRKEGHEITAITARSNSLHQVTKDWLIENGLLWLSKKIHFVDPHIVNRAVYKAELARNIGLNVFIEDHAPTLSKISGESIMVKLLINYPWNTGEITPSQTCRVDNWFQMDSIIQEASCWKYHLATCRTML